MNIEFYAIGDANFLFHSISDIDYTQGITYSIPQVITNSTFL